MRESLGLCNMSNARMVSFVHFTTNFYLEIYAQASNDSLTFELRLALIAHQLKSAPQSL